MTEVRLELPIRAAVITADRVRVSDNDRAHAGFVACGAAYRAAHGLGATPSSVAGVDHARRLFRELGIDPTKRRPSSEALLQRALKDKPLPKINSLVDLGNWCSLDALLPLGLYDRSRIEGDVVLRRGLPGEGYAAIGGKTMHLEGRYLLADDAGAFGSPITDSLRTSVSPETTATLVLLYAVAEFDPAELRRRADELAARLVEYIDAEGVAVRLEAGPGVVSGAG